MISAGTNIRSQSDALKKVDLGYIHQSIVSPRPDMNARMAAIRASAGIDRGAYAEAKRSLPYFVCANFNPPFRKTENFTYTEYFFVDIDSVSKSGRDVKSLSETLKEDSRVVMLFVSPSGDGLKVLFHLEDRCCDPGVYCVFYKAFVLQFAAQYHLEGIVDMSTSDVTRACFYSIDAEAYYNPFADTVDLSTYVDTTDVLGMFDLKRELDAKVGSDLDCVGESMPDQSDPGDEVLDKIKGLLSGKADKLSQKRDVYVPSQVNDVMAALIEYLEQNGLSVSDVRDIQYGKKISIALGSRSAELNLFYGRKGYTVVATTKRGTSLEFSSTCCDLIRLYFAERGL